MYQPTFRPIISVIRMTPDESVVEVTLDLSGHLSNGFGDIVDGDVITAAARATCAAVGRLIPEAGELSLVWAHRFEHSDDDGSQSSIINCAVAYHPVGRQKEEVLMGAAMVHHDEAVATVRATLDGLTRRLAPALMA